jgi:TPR repeat protein
MGNLWRTFFGYSDAHEGETFDEAVRRARALMGEENYEDACRILRHAEREQHAEGMHLMAWCCWQGLGVRENAGQAIDLWRKAAAMGYEPARKRSEELKAARDKMKE